MKELEYGYTDTGYCRVVYFFKCDGECIATFCAQEERPGQVVFYRCTDDYHEPMHAVKLKVTPPKSPGNTEVDKAVNEWIDQLDLAAGALLRQA